MYLGKARGVGGFERLVAIKVCHDHLRREGRFVEMFLNEARLAAKIHHPNVVATIDVQEEEHLYLVDRDRELEGLERDLTLADADRETWRRGGEP